jgi:hypothetical protein
MLRLWVQVIEKALNHSGIEQQPRDLMTLPGTARVSQLVVDQELIVLDRDFCVPVHHLLLQ